MWQRTLSQRLSTIPSDQAQLCGCSLPDVPAWQPILPDGTVDKEKSGAALAFLVSTGFSLLVLAGVAASTSDRRYVRSGIPAVGTITRRWAERDDDSLQYSYKIRYFFEEQHRGGSAGTRHEKTECLNQLQWNEVKEGDCITILYLPGKSGPYVIYRFSQYVSLEA